MYRATTRGIEVQVTPRFLSERSSPENGYYFWAYTIEITNRGSATVQLKTRHWKITDAHGKLQEVRGAGVVGETPTLEPGESFEYTSGVPLPTPSGFMTGTYGMETEGGEGSTSKSRRSRSTARRASRRSIDLRQAPPQPIKRPARQDREHGAIGGELLQRLDPRLGH